jgi:hypothetical protein
VLEQCASDVQFVRHAFVPQTYAPQLLVAAWLQVPLPEQDDAGWKVVPVQETPRPQAVDAAACWQPLAPLHVPVLPQGALAGHWPAGAGVPSASGVQVPGVVPLQVWQVPQAALPQQTPSTQLPLMHWLAAPQIDPLGLSAQFRFGAVPWQVNGDVQWESIEHVLRQVSPPHW